MPRKPRERSESGIYHIILRGINRRQVFFDEEDNLKFLQALRDYKEICAYQLFAYCIMGNHLHLLLKVEGEPLEQIMRRICGSFVYWYNRKYNRIGQLFQDRFRSEPVEDDSYFFTVLRYIHRNPIAAGLSKDLKKYPWSSFKAYLHSTPDQKIFLDTAIVLKMFDKDTAKAIKAFTSFHQKSNTDSCLEIEDTHRINDLKAKEIIRTALREYKKTDIKKLDRHQRDLILNQLKNQHKLSIRQIERLTDLSRGIIQKA